MPHTARSTSWSILLVVVLAAVWGFAGGGSRFQHGGGPITVDGISLATTWEDVVTRIGPPASRPSEPVLRWPNRRLSVGFHQRQAVFLIGPRLEQNGSVLVQAGDTEAQLVRSLGRPSCIVQGDYQYPQLDCAVHIREGHVHEICLGDQKGWLLGAD